MEPIPYNLHIEWLQKLGKAQADDKEQALLLCSTFSDDGMKVFAAVVVGESMHIALY